LIKDLNDEMRLTSVLVSHDIAEACAIADRIILLGEGRVLAHDTPEALQTSTDPAVRQFRHGEADGVIPFHFPAPPLAEELLCDHASVADNRGGLQ